MDHDEKVTKMAELMYDAVRAATLRKEQGSILEVLADLILSVQIADERFLPDNVQGDAERIELARKALIDTGHFRPDQVGKDIAPRITELVSDFEDTIKHMNEMIERLT